MSRTYVMPGVVEDSGAMVSVVEKIVYTGRDGEGRSVTVTEYHGAGDAPLPAMGFGKAIRLAWGKLRWNERTIGGNEWADEAIIHHRNGRVVRLHAADKIAGIQERAERAREMERELAASPTNIAIPLFDEDDEPEGLT